jgi:hypothetical protein
MPSPFPGMDPYLEAPDIWPDFHDALAGGIRAVLNQLLPSPYYARLQMRPEIGILDSEERPRRMVPDVAVVHPGRPVTDSGATAMLDAPRMEVSECMEVYSAVDPIRHLYVEVRDPSRDHKLVTLIEIVSPSNKRMGKDRDAYLEKQQEILASDASLVEIDLLRGGQRLLSGEGLAYWLDRHQPPADYVIVVNRAWNRDKSLLYPIHVRESLPVVRLPLREGEKEIPLDIQFIVNQAYDRGPYRRGAVDYSQPPSPPLCEEDAAWAEELLRPLRMPG